MEIGPLKALFIVLLPAVVLATSSNHFLLELVGQPFLEYVFLFFNVCVCVFLSSYLFARNAQISNNNNESVHLC